MAENKKIDTAKAEKAVKKADKKPSLASRIGKFFREYKAELGKVTWASRSTTLKNALVVAVTVIIVGIVVYGLDLAFENGIRALGNLI